MAFAAPNYSKSQVNKAGEILADLGTYSASEQEWASRVLANWRACHGYPINTFQATLRDKLKPIDENAIVAQRLKRAPSIILKLRRFNGMKLARMQDIGGLRAVVGSVEQVNKLEDAYRKSRFKHELTSSKTILKNLRKTGTAAFISSTDT